MGACPLMREELHDLAAFAELTAGQELQPYQRQFIQKLKEIQRSGGRITPIFREPGKRRRAKKNTIKQWLNVPFLLLF